MIWQFSKIAVVLVLSTTIALFTAHHEPRFNFPTGTKIILYPVKGDSTQQIKRALLKHGPKDQYGFKRYGMTRWLIKWNINEKTREVSVSYGIRVILPNLEIKNNHKNSFLQKWNKFSEAIIQHEQHHANRAVQTARTIKVTLSSIIKNNPTTPITELNQVAFKLIRRNQEWDLAFDKETSHGKNKGVEL